jgi:putative redox protein
MRYLEQVVDTRSTGQDGAVTAEETGAGRYQTVIRAGGTHFLSDEPESVGGLGSGPTPFDLLSAALASCTTMTLRMYADQKRMPELHIKTSVGYVKEPGADVPDLFVRELSISGSLSDADRERLLNIAERCPVHRILGRGARITTHLGEPPAQSSPVDTHARMMESSVSERAPA